MGGQQGSKRPGGLQLRGVVGQGKAMLLIALWECREKVQREGTVSISRCSELDAQSLREGLGLRKVGRFKTSFIQVVKSRGY